MKGNKGEWSEIYTFLKLLGEGRLFAADSELKPIEDIYYPILAIMRNEKDGKKEYLRNGNIKILDGNSGALITELPVNECLQRADVLLKIIKEQKGVFSAPMIEEFLRLVEVNTLKAPSDDKSDIQMKVHDLNTGMNPILGFSIKSKLGNPSTLLNASQATNFIYKVNIPSNQIDIETINYTDEKNKVRLVLQALDEAGCTLEYCGMDNEIFHLNLQIIDSQFPKIMAELLLLNYQGRGSKLQDLIEILEDINPCKYNLEHNHNFYRYKTKNFLTDVALGMTPTTVWNGHYDATGGYIIVKEDGDVLCYHIYNRNEFQDYLLKNTKFDTPSTSRHGFATVYEEAGEYYIKLNSQIRFI